MRKPTFCPHENKDTDHHTESDIVQSVFLKSEILSFWSASVIIQASLSDLVRARTPVFTSFLVSQFIRADPWENKQSSYAKTKTQISFAVTAKLISAFVFATRIVQFLLYLTPKFQASSLLLKLYRPDCVRPGRKPHCCLFHEAAH